MKSKLKRVKPKRYGDLKSYSKGLIIRGAQVLQRVTNNCLLGLEK